MAVSLHEQQEAERLLPILLKEEEELQFTQFTNDDSLILGSELVANAKKEYPGQGIAILITRNSQILFQHAMKGNRLPTVVFFSFLFLSVCSGPLLSSFKQSVLNRLTSATEKKKTIGATVDSENWLRRKNNTVVRLQHSSYYIGRSLASKGQKEMEQAYKVSMTDFACHGGGFPLLIKNVGCVGAVVVSGLKQDQDHALVVKSIQGLMQRHASVSS